MHQFDAYQTAEVNTSDSVRIITLLYDGALNFLKLARAKMEEGDIAGKGLYIGKTTAIVGELSTSLNMEQGGEIARNLRRLYDFVFDRLLKANLKNDPGALAEAAKVLDILRSGWKEMERNQLAAQAVSIKSSGGAGLAARA
jgi:flagellar protein FliS